MPAAFACACALLVAPGAAVASPAPPSQDPFYRWSGSLAGIAPGTVLRSRSVTVTPTGAPGGVQGTQVLYRTQNQLGQPTATVATIIQPAGAASPARLISYQTFYDGVADKCRPSYTLQGGDPSNSTAAADGTFLMNYVAQGYTVVTSDYEGPTDDYGAGRESGYGTLDAVRAAEHQLGLGAKTTPVGLVGYSGGSIASMWAAQLQPSYAPELDVVGTAAGGIPVDFIHNLAYIDGSPGWAGAIPAVGIGLARAYELDLPRYLDARGKQIVAEVSKGCLNPSAYPGLKFEDMLAPRYRDWKRVPVFVRMFDDSIMGRSGTPKEPLFMAVGNQDGTGDGVMIAKDVQQLAHEYCTRGLPVQFHEYSGQDHTGAAIRFEPEAIEFLQERFDGVPAQSDCATIGPGNALDPLPFPAARRPAPAHRLRLSGLRRRGARYTVLVRATPSRLTNLDLTVYRLGRKGHRTRAGFARIRGAVGTRARRVTVPLRRPVAGARYLLVAQARSGRRTVRASRTFRVPARRPRRDGR